MPNRVIKESIHESEKLNSLSDFNFRLWVYLLTYVDDYGRGDARPAIIKGNCFPLRDRVTAKDIDAGLHALSDAGCVSLYTVGGKPYLCLIGWEKHQRIQQKRSKYPGPDEADAPDGCGEQMMPVHENPRWVTVSHGESPPESESESESESERESRAREERFARFWTAYPRKTAKPTAQTAFAKLHPDDDLLRTMLAAIERQKQSPQWRDAQFIPHPATWLNQRRWEDETPRAAVSTGKTVPAQQYAQRDYSGADDAIPDWVYQRGREMGILQGGGTG